MECRVPEAWNDDPRRMLAMEAEAGDVNQLDRSVEQWSLRSSKGKLMDLRAASAQQVVDVNQQAFIAEDKLCCGTFPEMGCFQFCKTDGHLLSI